MVKCWWKSDVSEVAPAHLTANDSHLMVKTNKSIFKQLSSTKRECEIK